MKKSACLLIVDLQNGFINEFTKHLPPQIESVAESFEFIVATKFINTPLSPHSKLMGWTKFYEGTDETGFAFCPSGRAIVIEKKSYTIPMPVLLNFIEQNNIDSVILCGVDTEICVLKNAVELFEAGQNVFVAENICASHGGQHLHTNGLEIMSRFIGNRRIIRLN